MKHRKKWLYYPLGLLVGTLNGLFGAGGGMIAVPMLRGMGLEGDESHATSLAMMLPLSVMSGWLYLRAESFALGDAAVYLPGGLFGAIVGAWLLPKLKTIWLRRVFGVVVLLAAGRILLQ